METFAALIAALNQLTPIGLAGLIAVLVYALFSKRSPLVQIKDNHLSHIEASLRQIAANMGTQTGHLESISTDIKDVRDGISWIRGKLD
jgi:hypothetical protein